MQKDLLMDNPHIKTHRDFPVLLPVYRRSDLKIVRGEGVYLFDDKNNKYLDFSAGIAVNSFGHCHPEMIAVLLEQAQNLWHASNLFTLPIQNKLAQKLVDNSFADTVFFASTGVEAVETAIKMIRRYFQMQYQPNKYRIITMEGGFHGRSIATISASKNKYVTEGFYPLLDGFDQVPINDKQALLNNITDKTAAIMIEPIQGEGGIRVISDEYIKFLKEVADKYNLLLFFDEVQCGLGRTGSLFRYQQIGVEPDILAIAKGLGNGFPVSACLTTKEVAQYMTPGSHGSTFGGNPLGMACANKVLDMLLEDNTLDRINELSAYLDEKLKKLAAKYHYIISEVLGVGLIRGLKINNNISACTVMKNLREAGILVSVTQNNTIRITPPYIIDYSHIDMFYKLSDQKLKLL